MIGIVDYGAGNLLSVKNALDYLGFENIYVSEPDQFDEMERLILPGVGSFGASMKNIRERKLEDPIMEYLEEGERPFLGICLGLQLLFEQSEESPGIPGFGIFKGDVKRFETMKVPQIGWNEIVPVNTDLIQRGYVYFVNSYYVDPKDSEIIATKTDYGIEFVSAVEHENIIAMQFHPEKSGKFGLKLLERWVSC